MQDKITTPSARGTREVNIMPNKTTQAEVLNRLRTIKGHVAGVERMVAENSPCNNVLLQLLAIRASVEKTGIFILENNMTDCLVSDNIPPAEKQQLDQLIKSIISFLK